MDSYLSKLSVYLDKKLGVTDGIRSSRIQKNGNTKLNSTDWRKIAQRMYEIGIEENGKGGKWRGKVYEAIGKPFWDTKGNPVTDVSKGQFYQFKTSNGIVSKPYSQEQMQKYGKTQSTNRKNVTNVLDPAVQKQADALTKAGKWPKGKSLAQFLGVEKAGETRLMNRLSGLRALGLDATDGHIREVGGKGNKNGTPLDAKGDRGSNSFRSRVPQLGKANLGKGNGDIKPITGQRAGIPMTNSAAFNQYLLSNDQGTGTNASTTDKQRIAWNKENPDRVLAQRKQFVDNIVRSKYQVQRYGGMSDLIGMDDTMYNPEDIYYEELFDQPNHRGLSGGPFSGI
tara:strand:+ start:77 stop:1096 length:1020 start_codon:yes stop_codon:yes gene_type:complete